MNAGGVSGTSTIGRAPACAATAVARVALIVVAALTLACAARSTRPPNVLLVVLDTVRADRCSVLGGPRATTPRLEDLARDGVVFEDAWSPASWTAPAHAALFTGRAPHRLGVLRGTDFELTGGETLAERLRTAGWDTAVFSANPWVGPEFGLTRGFADMWHRLPDASGHFVTADRVGAAAVAWIRRHRRAARSAPWFLYMNLMDPHAPCDPLPEPSARFVRPGLAPDVVADARTLNGPRGLLAASLNGTPLPDDVDAAVSDLYDACVATVDAEVGRILDDLRAAGDLDRTLVVIASDHGEGLGDHGWREHGLRLHRELLRVPLVVRFPGTFDGGRRVPDLVSLTDVFPTVLGLCGLPPGPEVEGTSLAAPRRERLVFATDRPYAGWAMLAGTDIPDHWRTQLENVGRSVYDGRHHLIASDGGAVELYDVLADPGERTNLGAGAPEVVERLRGAIDREFGAR